MRLLRAVIFVTATSATAVAGSKVPLRVVRVMPETHQALLYDRSADTHVLVEVGKSIDGYVVEDIDDDEVTLAGGDGQEVVLAGPDWHRRDARPAVASAEPAGPAAAAKPAAPAEPAAPVAANPAVPPANPAVPAANPAAPMANPAAPTANPATAPASTAPVTVAVSPSLTITAAPSSGLVPEDPYAPQPAQPAQPIRVVEAPGAAATLAPLPAVTPAAAPAGAPAPVPTAAPAVIVAPAPAPAPTPAAAPTPAPAAPAPTAPAAPVPAAPAVAAVAPTAPAAAIPAVPMLGRAEVAAAIANFSTLASSVHGTFTPDGARLDVIQPDSLFAKVGLRAGDVIAAVDGRPMRSLDDAAILYARAPDLKAVTLAVIRAGKPLTVHVVIQ